MKLFKTLALILSLVILISCGNKKNTITNTIVENPEIGFHINLNDRSNDTFKVKVTVPKLTADNNIFQFAATAPGTYQIMDMGRFVSTFKAYDKNGKEVSSTKINTNQYQLENPERVHTIQYQITETFDTKIKEHPVYPMAGTSIENNHALINGQAVFGYIKGLQQIPINISIEYPENWIVGSALKLNDNATFSANNYDHLVDSPILLGELTKTSTNVSGTTVDIYTYSEKGMINSDMVLETLEEMLVSADLFLEGLPVDHYTFLLHFETNNIKVKGAWEHSYSSEYTLQEKPWAEIEKKFKDTAAHEFFHIVTPLNIHSEIIQEFNFIEPVASKHLWLYEGTTEWAAHMMQFRAGQKTTEEYLNTLRRKVFISQNYFDKDYTLLDLSLNSFTEAGHKQYPNIYMKGALVAGLLDIKLLELSNGKRGLVDVINELAKKYGPNKPFEDATFFQTFVEFTNPEIGDFMDLYIKKETPLPLKEYYQKIGIIYNNTDVSFVLDENATEKQLQLRNSWMEQLK